MVLNLFYEEPDADRWFAGDRYPRRLVRRLVRGRPPIGGQRRVFLNLCAGLDRIGVRYRVNDYRHATRHPQELVCIIGKPCVLDKADWQNPILFGASGYSHPVDDPHLFQRKRVRTVLVPGPWMREMCEPYWGDAVAAWPVGIDTGRWCPAPAGAKRIDVLLYDKVRWEHDRYETMLIEPIRNSLETKGLSVEEIRYGNYREADFHQTLGRCRAMIFLCEHETQGIAYQQALSCGVPILAWDRRGYWKDPAYYPHKVRFRPVTSVPYWDERCGMTFESGEDFPDLWREFWKKVGDRQFSPRDYIVENLTLERAAEEYVGHVRGIEEQM